jgi:hypothetical protein
MRRMLPRRLLPWLFALTLLWGQAVAYAHAVSHLTDTGLPAHACELCVAQASLGSAAASTPPVLHLPVAAHDWFVADARFTHTPRLPAPRARAPPALL